MRIIVIQKAALCFMAGVVMTSCQSSEPPSGNDVPVAEKDTPAVETKKPQYYNPLSDTAGWPRPDEFTEGYGDLIWGMTSEEVRTALAGRQFTLGRNRLGEPVVHYIDTISSAECEAILSFSSDTLFAIHLSFNVDGLDATTLETGYQRLRAMLSMEYGDPEWMRAPDDTIGMGASWFTEQTEVVIGYLRLTGHDPELSIRYRCPSLSRPANLPPLL